MFYRTACSYCQRLKPTLEDLADEFASSVFMRKVNIDFIDEARERFSVLGVSLVVAFKKGMQMDRVGGLREYDEYHEWIDQIRNGIRPMRLDSGEMTSV